MALASAVQAEGVAGLTRDKTRKPGKPPLPPATVQRVLDLALGPPPQEATHWTGRMLANRLVQKQCLWRLASATYPDLSIIGTVR